MRKSASSVSDRPFGTDLRPEVDGDPPLSAVDLLKILRRRRALILLTIFVVAAMGSILAMSLPRLYRAEALLIFDPRKQRVTDFPDVISSLPSEIDGIPGRLSKPARCLELATDRPDCRGPPPPCV